MVRSSALEKERRLEKAPPSREEIVAERRDVIKKGVYLAAAGVVVAVTAGSVGALLPPPLTSSSELNWYNGGRATGKFPIFYEESGVRSQWWTASQIGQPVMLADFPGPGHGMLGRVSDLPNRGMDVIVEYLDPAIVDPSMKGIEPPGLVAFNATCKHLQCIARWWEQEEAREKLGGSVTPQHDIILCTCHLSTYDPYQAAKVIYGPAPEPLDQLKVVVENGAIMIEFTGYQYHDIQGQVK